MVTCALPHPYALARLADCGDPDGPSSAGAAFLLGVAQHVAERDGEEPAAIADAAVPVYDAQVWSAFVDLGAWREDVAELRVDAGDLTACARVALFVVAERLAGALLDDE